MESEPTPIIEPRPMPPRQKHARRRQRAAVAKTGAPSAAAPSMSPDQIAELAARIAKQVAADAIEGVIAKLTTPQAMHPKPVVPPVTDAGPTAGETEGDDFDPLDPKVQRTARQRLNGGAHAVPRAQGMSDEEVLAMFQGEELGEFDVPREIIPDGMVYGWKRKEVVGREDKGYEAELMRRGWTAVLHSDHPGLFGMRDETGPILRKGLMLMKRQAEMEELRQRYWRLTAKQAVRDKVAQMGQAPPGTGPRSHPKLGNTIKRTYEPLPIEQ
jgi:hypothetical protein